jgi:hypothetical protein
MRKIHKVAGAVLGLAIGAVMGTGAASASVTHHRHHHITVQPGGPIILTALADTPECAASVQTHNGVTGNYCASQEIVSDGIELAVPNKATAYARLTFKPTSTANPAEDFEFYNPAVHGDNQKIFEWAPRGVPSGLCAAVSNSGALLVLKPCKPGSAGQQWDANGPDPSGGYEWTSEANGRAISDPNGAPYTRAVLVTVGGSSFTYVQ